MIGDLMWRRRQRRAVELLEGLGADLRLIEWARDQHQWSLKTPLRDLPFVVLDTESTGLDPVKDRVLTFAGVGLHEGRIRIGDSLSVRFKRGEVGGLGAARIHGLMPVDLAEGAEEADAIARIMAFIGGRIIVGHHVGFDRALLAATLQRALNVPQRLHLLNATVDTGLLSRALLRLPTDQVERPVEDLDTTCERWGVPIDHRHTAAGDALTTAQLALILFNRFEARCGDTWGVLRKRIG